MSKRNGQSSGYAMCWALRHAMDLIDEPDDWPMPDSDLWYGARYILHLQCLRCGTCRALAMDWRCKMLRSVYYNRPDGYLGEPGDTSRVPQRARLSLVKGSS